MFLWSSCSHARSTALLCYLLMAYESAGVISWPFLLSLSVMSPSLELTWIPFTLFTIHYSAKIPKYCFVLIKNRANVWALVILTCWWWWKLQYINIKDSIFFQLKTTNQYSSSENPQQTRWKPWNFTGICQKWLSSGDETKNRIVLDSAFMAKSVDETIDTSPTSVL